MEEVFRDCIFAFVIIFLVLGFAILLFLPKCCQKYSQKSQKLRYEIESNSTLVKFSDESFGSESEISRFSAKTRYSSHGKKKFKRGRYKVQPVFERISQDHVKYKTPFLYLNPLTTGI